MDLKAAVRDVLGVREQPGAEWTATCFSPDHDDKNASASVNVEKGLWVCYSCHRGGRVEDLLSGVRIADPSPDDNLSAVDANLTEDTVRVYPEGWLSLFRQRDVHPYWLSRFKEETCRFWDLGYDYETDTCTYPLRSDSGAVLGVVRRRLDGGQPKYKYPKGVKTHDLLFGYHEGRLGMPYTHCVLVEGALDVISLWESGITALGIYGSRISPRQVKILRWLNPSSVTLAFDMDRAGLDAAEIVMSTDLPDCCPVYQATWDPAEGKDVAELSEARRIQVIRDAELL